MGEGGGRKSRKNADVFYGLSLIAFPCNKFNRVFLLQYLPIRFMFFLCKDYWLFPVHLQLFPIKFSQKILMSLKHLQCNAVKFHNQTDPKYQKRVQSNVSRNSHLMNDREDTALNFRLELSKILTFSSAHLYNLRFHRITSKLLSVAI